MDQLAARRAVTRTFSRCAAALHVVSWRIHAPKWRGRKHGFARPAKPTSNVARFAAVLKGPGTSLRGRQRECAAGWQCSGCGFVGGPAGEHMEPVDHLRPRDPGVVDRPGDFVDRQTFLVEQAGQIPRVDTPEDVVKDRAFVDVGRLGAENPAQFGGGGLVAVAREVCPDEEMEQAVVVGWIAGTSSEGVRMREPGEGQRGPRPVVFWPSGRSDP